MFTALLSLANISVMGLALFKHTALAAWGAIAIQVPWCIWDVKTHNQWFFLIAAGTFLISSTALWRQRVRLYPAVRREFPLVFSAL